MEIRLYPPGEGESKLCPSVKTRVEIATMDPRMLKPEVIKMRREKRGGHEIIVIEGFPGGTDLDGLARELKRRCGTGGTVKGASIEIQGDHRDAIAEELLKHGFRSKRAGG